MGGVRSTFDPVLDTKVTLILEGYDRSSNSQRIHYDFPSSIAFLQHSTNGRILLVLYGIHRTDVLIICLDDGCARYALLDILSNLVIRGSRYYLLQSGNSRIIKSANSKIHIHTIQIDGADILLGGEDRAMYQTSLDQVLLFGEQSIIKCVPYTGTKTLIENRTTNVLLHLDGQNGYVNWEHLGLCLPTVDKKRILCLGQNSLYTAKDMSIFQYELPISPLQFLQSNIQTLNKPIQEVLLYTLWEIIAEYASSNETKKTKTLHLKIQKSQDITAMIMLPCGLIVIGVTSETPGCPSHGLYLIHPNTAKVHCLGHTEFKFPDGFALDLNNHNLYVSDYESHKICCLELHPSLFIQT